MFTAIVRFSIKKKLFVGLTTLFLFIGGIYAMLTKSKMVERPDSAFCCS